MKKTDRKIELLGKLQEELDRRIQVEEEAVRLISNGECEKACELLNALDDSIAKSIRQELDQLENDTDLRAGLQEHRSRVDIHVNSLMIEIGRRDTADVIRILEGYLEADRERGEHT